MSDRALAILIGIVVLAVMGTLGVRYYLKQHEPVAAVKQAPAPVEKPQTLVRVWVTTCERRYGRTEMTGYIENVGNVELHYVTVNAIWKTADGLVLSTDRVYALSDRALPVGQQKEFHATTDLASAARCNAEAMDWW